MKILVLTYSYPNLFNTASAPFCRDHALALKKSGNDVFVLSVIPISLKYIWKNKCFDFRLKKYTDQGVETWVQCFPGIPKMPKLNNFIRTFLGFYYIKKIFRDVFIPDIIHVHGFLSGDIAVKANKYNSIPFVVTEHSSGFAQNTYTKFHIEQARRVYKNAKARIAVSETFANLLKRKFSLDFIFIPNVVPSEYVKHIKPIIKDNHHLRICNVAHLDKKKRHERMITAFSKIKDKYPNAELHIAGCGPELSNLKKLTEVLNLRDCIYFHGKLSRQEVFNLMGSCDIFAHSSEYETFGVVLIEAMICGLPILSTKSGGPESIITDDELGVLTENEDSCFEKGLFEIIEKYYNNEFDKKKISLNAMNKYTYKVIGERVCSIYKEVLKEYHFK